MIFRAAVAFKVFKVDDRFGTLKVGDRFVMTDPVTQLPCVYLKTERLECTDKRCYNAVCLHTAQHLQVDDEMPVIPIML